MNEVPWIGLAYFALVALVLFLIRADERREKRYWEERVARDREAAKPPTRNREHDWHEAYLVSKSTKTETEWREWMESRGYGPEAVLERAELRDQVVKRKR